MPKFKWWTVIILAPTADHLTQLMVSLIHFSLTGVPLV